MDAEEEAGTIGGRSVASAWFGGGGFEEVDYVGMDLLEEDELEIVGAQCGLEAAAVFEDVFLAIPFGKTEIEKSFAVMIRNTAGFGAETMDEPGELGESGRLEDSDAAHVALGPNTLVTGASA